MEVPISEATWREISIDSGIDTDSEEANRNPSGEEANLARRATVSQTAERSPTGEFREVRDGRQLLDRHVDICCPNSCPASDPMHRLPIRFNGEYAGLYEGRESGCGAIDFYYFTNEDDGYRVTAVDSAPGDDLDSIHIDVTRFGSHETLEMMTEVESFEVPYDIDRL